MSSSNSFDASKGWLLNFCRTIRLPKVERAGKLCVERLPTNALTMAWRSAFFTTATAFETISPWDGDQRRSEIELSLLPKLFGS